MKLIVGIGNPGKEYEKTRHNVGFMILDKFAEKYNFSFTKKKFGSVYSEQIIKGEKLLVMKPMEYVNVSGEAVQKLVSFYKIPINDIIVVHDDMDISLGNIKLKQKGNDGGHNGIKSIISNLGTNEFKRLKIGIGKSDIINTKDFVLGKISSEELIIMEKVIENSVNILDDFVSTDFILLMNKYN